MFIELNDKHGSIINLDYVLSVRCDAKFKRITIAFKDARNAEECYVYNTAEEIYNDKHRIKNKIGL